MTTLTRRRREAPSEGDDVRDTLLAMEPPNKHRPSCAQLLPSASKHGWLWKRRRPIVAKLFPALINHWCCKDVWRERYFVLAGRFLFRYDSDDGAKPKGTPLPVESCTFRALDGDDDNSKEHATDSSSEESNAYWFAVSTVRQEYVLRCESEEERSAWLSALSSAQHRAIKENMGHAAVDPKHDIANMAGSFLFQRRLEKDASEVSDMQGTEMAMMSGAAPRSGLGL